MKKIIIYIFILLVLVLTFIYSPTILTYSIKVIKRFNPNVTKLGIKTWLSTYATLIGGITSLLAFFLFFIVTSSQIKKQHKQMLGLISYQEEIKNIDNIQDSITQLINNLNMCSKVKNVKNNSIDITNIIDDIKNNIMSYDNKLHVISDINNNDKLDLKNRKLSKQYNDVKIELKELLQEFVKESLDMLNKYKTNPKDNINKYFELHKNKFIKLLHLSRNYLELKKEISIEKIK